MNFEESVNKIDEIIKKLSSGDVPLEEAVELYKAGADELAECKKKLDNAEKNAMKITFAEDIG